MSDRKRIAELEQEQAAILQGIRKEFTIGGLSGDILQDFATFIEHHNKTEAALTERDRVIGLCDMALRDLYSYLGRLPQKSKEALTAIAALKPVKEKQG
jgi:hypothetical protein